jgi:hypothetical protein
MKRPRFKDLRQGVTVYTVSGYDPLCCDVSGNVWKSEPEKHFVTGKPYMHTDIGWRVPTRRVTSWGSINTDGFFLSTYMIANPERRGWGTAHRCFWTYEAAARYAARMRRGCMTKAEQEHAEKWAETREEMRAFDREFLWDHWPDQEPEEETEYDERQFDRI